YPVPPDLHARLTNIGEAREEATAIAQGATNAVANAFAEAALLQNVTASHLAATMTNAGAVSVTADASAIARSGAATAVAVAAGMGQRSNALAGTALILTNSGTLTVDASAKAITGSGAAVAVAFASHAAVQFVSGTGAHTLDMNDSGTILVAA